MPLEIIRNDITRMRVDAIVNAANASLMGGGGVDGAIHRAAGPGLLEECRALGGCRTGEAKATGGHRLPCKYVIHTVGPVWHGGGADEEALLARCYQSALTLAHARGCESVAFPLISAGAYGFPRELALQIAVETARAFLEKHDMRVILVLYDAQSFRLCGGLYENVAQYIDDYYVHTHTDAARERRRAAHVRHAAVDSCPAAPPFFEPCESMPQEPSGIPHALREALGSLDETFSQMLLRKIDERGMKDSACYKKANLDRKLFSKIRSDVHYKPSKRTALALAVALELPLHETQELLHKAGLALSHSSKFDVIIEYCIQNGIYDIYTINRILFDFDQALLGA